MKKKTIIILSFVSAILSLIYILLSHSGYFRYGLLYMSSTDGYIPKYKQLDQVNKDKRVVISITTSPKQIQKISPIIRSLLDQTVKVDLISIVVPYNKPSKKYNIPNDIKNSLSVFRHEGKHGKLIVLIPTIRREGEGNTQIITLGDKTIYGKDFIQDLLETADKNPGKIIYANSDIINLDKGVVFETDFFDESFFKIPKNMSSNDWINKYFKNHPKKSFKYRGNISSMMW